MSENELKQKLIDAGKILAFEGQGDLTRGHVSVRVPGDPTLFFMKPHSHGLDEITLDNIVILQYRGREGRRRGAAP
jgi:ribulose-5-phosphate 4-epimerase/fuculose-1-phosphate aldolase